MNYNAFVVETGFQTYSYISTSSVNKQNASLHSRVKMSYSSNMIKHDKIYLSDRMGTYTPLGDRKYQLQLYYHIGIKKVKTT